MSDPLEPTGAAAPTSPEGEAAQQLLRWDSRVTSVGGAEVHRSLPRRERRTVGAWCLCDHFGPSAFGPAGGMDVPPHPHLGLQTVTWLLRGEVVHRDSLGNEQVIRPGQLNLMTAGSGISHSEEHVPGAAGSPEGVQLWVAQPERTRKGAAAFEHHGDLPTVRLGPSAATVLVGALAGASSPARHDTTLVGADLLVGPGTTVVPVEAHWETAVTVIGGQVTVEGSSVGQDQTVFLGRSRTEVGIEAAGPARCLLLGGLPLAEPLLMWWNFVGRDRDEIVDAWRSWNIDDGRFGTVASDLERTSVGPPPWLRDGH